MKNLCFIANFEKTILLKAIANQIKKKTSYNIFWIVVNKKLAIDLEQEFGKGNICLVNKNFEKNYKINKELIVKIKLNEIIFQDRSLKKSSEKDYEYLKYATSIINEFIIKNKIEFIYGEITWAHEIIAYNLCNVLNLVDCHFFNPSTIRFPLNYFLFFKDSQQTNYFKRKNTHNIVVENIQHQYLDLIEKRKPKKIFTNINFILKKIKKFFYEDYFDKFDPTKINKFIRAINLIKKYLNLVVFNFITSKKSLEELDKYVVYFLQKKPEASIDVKGSYYDDQLLNFKNIWKILPSDFKILIKEHPSSIGDNSIFYYMKFKKFKNTILISDQINFDKLITNSYATFSVASTASLQSSLLNIPSFTLVNCFFNELQYSKRISLDDIKNVKNIEEIMLFQNNDRNKVDKTEYFKNSFEGLIIGNGMLEQKNIMKIADAFIETTL